MLEFFYCYSFLWQIVEFSPVTRMIRDAEHAEIGRTKKKEDPILSHIARRKKDELVERGFSLPDRKTQPLHSLPRIKNVSYPNAIMFIRPFSI